MRAALKLILLIASPCIATAQYTRPYFYAGAGTQDSRDYHAGAGLERLMDGGVGAAAEIEGIFPGRSGARKAEGIGSVDAWLHLLRRRKLNPVFYGGYSLLFRDTTANLFNFGGGIHYWFQQNRGLLFEFRDHTGKPVGDQRVHYWAIRVGLTFR